MRVTIEFQLSNQLSLFQSVYNSPDAILNKRAPEIDQKPETLSANRRYVSNCFV